MNVNGEILVINKENVLYVPMASVTKIKDRAIVYVKADSNEDIVNNTLKNSQ